MAKEEARSVLDFENVQTAAGALPKGNSCRRWDQGFENRHSHPFNKPSRVLTYSASTIIGKRLQGGVFSSMSTTDRGKVSHGSKKPTI